jgi:S-adenosylmethionine synthetase
MKTSYFLSPKHPSKVCDIAVETIVDTYFKEDINFYSDIFAFIYRGAIHLHGHMDVSSPISEPELLPKIKENIGEDYQIVNNIIVEESEDIDNERTFSGVYLGYSCNEVDEMIPFEHKESRELVRTIYNQYEIPLKAQVHVNGERIVVSLEHNFDNNEILDEIVREFFRPDEDITKKITGEVEIYHTLLRDDVVYKSSDSIISSFYGPRAWYGETDFVGSDFSSNKRLGHLIVREIANDYTSRKTLSYCAVEIDFTDDNPVPIHFGIKGNDRGIHLENGTFFEFGDIETEYPMYKERVLEKLKTGELDIIEIAKWGFPSTNI